MSRTRYFDVTLLRPMYHLAITIAKAIDDRLPHETNRTPTTSKLREAAGGMRIEKAVSFDPRSSVRVPPGT